MFPFHLLPIEMQAAAAAVGMIPKLNFVEPEVGLIVDVGVNLPDWAEDNPSIQRQQAQLQHDVLAATAKFMQEAEPHLRDDAKRQNSRNIERLASFGFTSEFLLKCCEPAFAMAVLERMLARRQQQVVAGLQERISGLQTALSQQHAANSRLRQRLTSAEDDKSNAEADRDVANRRSAGYYAELTTIRDIANASGKKRVASRAKGAMNRLARPRSPVLQGRSCDRIGCLKGLLRAITALKPQKPPLGAVFPYKTFPYPYHNSRKNN